MNEECSVNDIKNNTNTEDQETSTCNSKNPTDEPIQAPSNNDSTINHCSNSNESLSDSKNIVDGNPANMDQAVNENIEKSSDSDQAVNQNIEKSLDCNQAVNPDIEKSSDCDQAVNQNIEKSLDSTSEIHNTTDNADYEESEEIDSEEDSSDEEGSVGSEDARADTVSINSESGGEEETSPQSKIHNKDVTPIIIPDSDDIPKSQNGNLNGSPSSEVHEILSDNDDCISVNEDKSNRSSENENKDLRRSSRAIKRKTYDEMENGDCESDVEEVEVEDPLSCKTKPIVINNTKTLVQMAVKKIKTNNQKKEPTVVIIDTNSKKGPTTQIKNPTPMNNSHNIVPNLMARGTTVTPVSSKVNSSPQIAPQNPQPSILPSLTDDMFVVEAPSFIVPYVYEKPSIKAFREFVDKLGKELEEHKAKEEQERLEKEKIEKEKRDKEKRERRERGELVEESEDEKNKTDDGEDEKKKKKAEKKERRRRRNDDDDASWDGESSSDSEEDIISDDDTVVLKDKASSIEDIKDVSNLTAEKVGTGKSDNYFECSLGKFFVNIGMNMVQEYVQNDLLKQQNRKLYREKKSGHSTKATQSSIASLMKNLEFSKENNAPYTFPQTKCEFCSFKTESALVMSQHLETPHMKNNFYKCNFCEYEIRSPHDILYHMEAEHNVRGKLERAPAYHQCANCPFEDNGKGKLARHQIACAKKYKPELNLAPAVEWEPPAKIPKITRARNSMMGSYQSAFQRQLGNNMGKGPIPFASLMPPVSGIIRARGRSPLSGPMRAGPVHGIPIARAGVSSPARHHSPSPALMGSNYSMATNAKPRPTHQPSISITPLPRQPQPVQQQSQHSKSTFVICEICDGYIKDLEQLRNHMQWIHKVKIHPKMIYNRPPLNCQKCQFRFFTDQGLERHLLGSHGLVTSSMQEAANKGKDAGRCPVCGRVYQWKLLNHVARDHNLTLKPAHLSYKCTVCTATFGMYKQFENHVYSAHSVVAKRVMDKSKTSTSSARGINDMASLKPLKINDEITITPQPVKAATSKTK